MRVYQGKTLWVAGVGVELGERRAWTLILRLWTDPVWDRGSVCSERGALGGSEASGGGGWGCGGWRGMWLQDLPV